MIGTVFILFILLPALDLFLLLKLGQLLGIYETLLLIVVTGFIGAILYRTQTWLNFRKMKRTLQQGTVPDRELIDSILIIVGALLLVTPGVLTDIAGFLFLLPFTRPAIRKSAIYLLKRSIKGGRIQIQTL